MSATLQLHQADGDGGDHLSVPYSLTVPQDEKQLRRYGSIPMKGVSFDETHLGQALPESAEVDQIAVADLADYGDHRLRSKVEQAHLARLDAEANLRLRNERAEKSNAVVEARLEALEVSKDELLGRRTSDGMAAVSCRREAQLRCAEACARVGLPFDPENPVPSVPDAGLLKAPEAHAAQLNQPHCPGEKDVFWPVAVEWMALVLVGTALGLSIGSVAGLVHLGALAKSPLVAVLSSLIGIAVAMFAGASVKALWRTASESYYLGVSWRGKASVALAMTVFLAAIETVVDMRGLMASASLHGQVSALSGKGPVSDGQSVVLTLLLGATLSVAYFTYAAMSGWRKNRKAAANRIILSQEEERLERLAELRDQPGWIAALAACNQLVALDTIETHQADVYEQLLSALSVREQELRATLQPFCTHPTLEEIAIIDAAIQEAEGAQVQWDRRLAAIREGRIYELPKASQIASKGEGFWSKVRAFFKPRKRLVGGG